MDTAVRTAPFPEQGCSTAYHSIPASRRARRLRVRLPRARGRIGRLGWAAACVEPLDDLGRHVEPRIRPDDAGVGAEKELEVLFERHLLDDRQELALEFELQRLAELVDLALRVLVGALDVGGYFTLDASVIPDQAGPLDIAITIDYTDDFNQTQVLTDTLSVNVEEMMLPEPIPGEGGIDGDGIPEPEQPETVWQKVVRFLKGLFGLDSGTPTQPPVEIPPGEVPPQEAPPGIKPASGKG